MDKFFHYNDDEDDSSLSLRPEEIKIYRQGEAILQEGESSSLFFVIMDGQVEIRVGAREIRILEPQDVFGLESYSLKKPSPYSAIAMKESRVASYNREALDHFIRETPRMAQSILASVLRQLDQTSQNMLESPNPFLLRDNRIIFVSDGDTIIDEDSAGKAFYRLISTQKGLQVSTGGKVTAIIDTPGEFIGESAALLAIPHEATITSMGETVLEAYTVDNLDVIIRDYPEVALRMMQTLRSRWMQWRAEPTPQYREIHDRTVTENGQ